MERNGWGRISIYRHAIPNQSQRHRDERGLHRELDGINPWRAWKWMTRMSVLIRDDCTDADLFNCQAFGFERFE